jgi:hypothetical protein
VVDWDDDVHPRVWVAEQAHPDKGAHRLRATPHGQLSVVACGGSKQSIQFTHNLLNQQCVANVSSFFFSCLHRWKCLLMCQTCCSDGGYPSQDQTLISVWSLGDYTPFFSTKIRSASQLHPKKLRVKPDNLLALFYNRLIRNQNTISMAVPPESSNKDVGGSSGHTARGYTAPVLSNNNISTLGRRRWKG